MAETYGEGGGPKLGSGDLGPGRMRLVEMGRGFTYEGAGSGIMGQGLVAAGWGLVGLRLSLIDLGGA